MKRLTLVSGGQTGVDRAALDAARAVGVSVEGWVPAGRTAEDGTIPSRYRGLVETPTGDPAERTRWNVRDADAVLLVLRGPPKGGTLLALESARELGRPVLELDLSRRSEASAAGALQGWLRRRRLPLRLNVAGPRESEAPGVYEEARRVLEQGLAPFGRGSSRRGSSRPGPAPTDG
jgi:hypothetical protein